MSDNHEHPIVLLLRLWYITATIVVPLAVFVGLLLLCVWPDGRGKWYEAVGESVEVS
jgi:hypothetical protein